MYKSIARNLEEIISDTPKCINDSIEFTVIQKWKVSKINLLDQKRVLEEELSVRQIQLDKVISLLDMFEEQIGK